MSEYERTTYLCADDLETECNTPREVIVQPAIARDQKAKYFAWCIRLYGAARASRFFATQQAALDYARRRYPARVVYVFHETTSCIDEV